MRRTTFVRVLLFASVFVLAAAGPVAAKDTLYVSPGNLKYGVRGPTGVRFLDKKCYVIAYCDSWRIPFWSAYYLNRDTLKKDRPRLRQESYFRPDEKVPKDYRAIKADYRGSHYDRGHLAPAADFKRRKAAYMSTFLLSNMSPQHDSANQKVCGRIEDSVRSIARRDGEAWIVVGNTFLKGNLTPTTATERDSWIGHPKSGVPQKIVAVPSHMFRAVLARDDAGHWDAYAWLVPNTSKLPKEWKIADYQLTVDSLEKLVGWDFFSELSKPVQDKIEAELPH